jgi:predicted metal-dependent hydrolase
MDWILKQQRRLLEQEQEFARFCRLNPPLSEVEARRLLKERLELLARRFGFSYNRIYLRRQRTRWGSCSGSNNISLNLRLALLPPRLRDYVMLHELVHTRVPNHGQDFWRELNRFVDDPQGLRDRLRRIPLED